MPLVKASLTKPTGFLPKDTKSTNFDGDHECEICQDRSDIEKLARLWALETQGRMDDIPDEPRISTRSTSTEIVRTLSLRTLDLPNSQDNRPLSRKFHQKLKALRKITLTKLYNFSNVSFKTTLMKLTFCPTKTSNHNNTSPTISHKKAKKLMNRIKTLSRKADEKAKINLAHLEKRMIDLTSELLANMSTYHVLQEHGLEPINVLAIQLWTGFLKARHDNLSDESKTAPNLVAMARLMFAWVAYSIHFDSDLPGDDTKYRPLGDMLSERREVCREYAIMFITMSNALLHDGKDFGSRGTSSASDDGIQLQPGAKSYTLDHAWAANLMGDVDGIDDYKILDTIPRVAPSYGTLDPVWWSTMNCAPSWTDVPNYDMKQYKPVESVTPIDNIWEQPQPLFPTAC